MKVSTVKPSATEPDAEILSPIKTGSVDPRVRKVMLASEQRQFDSIQQLAQLVNLSGSRLSHLFKEQTGLVLSELLAKQRMGRAAHLLRSTELTINEISQQVGYCHATSFARSFKRIFDCSPIVYRIREQLLQERVGASPVT
jgi:AraC family transcriptional regulator, arabinose operon regulatory protein